MISSSPGSISVCVALTSSCEAPSPITIRSAPNANHSSTRAAERKPPPNWTGTPAVLMISISKARLLFSPLTASRSVTWIHSAPCATNSCTFFSGSTCQSSGSSIRPRIRLTQRPFCSSIVGYKIISALPWRPRPQRVHRAFRPTHCTSAPELGNATAIRSDSKQCFHA